MAQERVEPDPVKKLEALCSARDYYSSLAQTLHNKRMTSAYFSERDERHEKKARRFAAAYDRSARIQRAMITKAKVS